MKRILFLANDRYADPKRGTPLHMCYLFRELRKDHELKVCAATVPEEFKNIFVPFPRERGFKKIAPLLRIVRTERPEWVFTVNEGDLWIPILLKWFFGVRIAVEIQGVGFAEKYADGKISYIGYLYAKYQVWVLLHFYDIVFAVSQKLVDYYAPMSRKWVIIRGGAAIEEIPDQSDRAHDGASFTLGYMGNARAYQGLPYILEAAALLSTRNVPVRLNLILGGDSSKTEALLAARGLTDITTLHRNVPHEEANRLIGESDVLAIPRPSIPITEYAFPGKLAECLASGIPTVMTEVGPVAEMRPEIATCALIIPSDDISKHLADAYERVYRMSADERRALGKRAREFSQRTLSWDVLGPTYSDAFERAN